MQRDPATRLNPDFVDPVRAVYHYYKHRILPTGGALSESDYYCLINRTMARVKFLGEYRAFVGGRSDSSEFTRDIDMPLKTVLPNPLRGKVRIIIRLTEERKLVLATCFVLDNGGCR